MKPKKVHIVRIHSKNGLIRFLNQNITQTNFIFQLSCKKYIRLKTKDSYTIHKTTHHVFLISDSIEISADSYWQDIEFHEFIKDCDLTQEYTEFKNNMLDNCERALKNAIIFNNSYHPTKNIFEISFCDTFNLWKHDDEKSKFMRYLRINRNDYNSDEYLKNIISELTQ